MEYGKGWAGQGGVVWEGGENPTKGSLKRTQRVEGVFDLSRSAFMRE